MANLVSAVVSSTGIVATMDDGSTQTLSFALPVVTSGPTEAAVQAAADTAIEGAFTPPTA